MSVIVAGIEFEPHDNGVHGHTPTMEGRRLWLGAAQWRQPGQVAGIYTVGLPPDPQPPVPTGWVGVAGVAGSESIGACVMDERKCTWSRFSSENASLGRGTVASALEDLARRSRGQLPFHECGLPTDRLVPESEVLLCWASSDPEKPRYARAMVFNQYVQPSTAHHVTPVLAIGPGKAAALAAARVCLDRGESVREAVEEAVRAGRRAAGLGVGGCEPPDMVIEIGGPGGAERAAGAA